MNAINGDPYVGQLKTEIAEPGTLMMWPASLLHNVYPNLADRQRISINFNVVLEWSNSLKM